MESHIRDDVGNLADPWSVARGSYCSISIWLSTLEIKPERHSSRSHIATQRAAREEKDNSPSDRVVLPSNMEHPVLPNKLFLASDNSFKKGIRQPNTHEPEQLAPLRLRIKHDRTLEGPRPTNASQP
jgi:hypothetical protein